MNNNLSPKEKAALLVEKKPNKKFNIFLLITTIIILGIAGYIFFLNNTEKEQLTNLNSKIAKRENKQSKLNTDTYSKKYVVNGRGDLDENSRKTIYKITNIFSRITTYENAQDYSQNERIAKKYILDNSFYKTFLTPDKDNTGNSIIEALHLKSMNDDVKVYQILSGKYYVIVDYFVYKKKSTLNHKNAVETSTKAFVVSGDYNQLNNVDQIKNLELTNS